MGFRLTLFSLKNKSSRTLDKMSLKLEMKGVSLNQATFLLKCKCVKYSLVQKRIRKLIAYYMAHFSIVKHLMVRNLTLLNENFYWHSVKYFTDRSKAVLLLWIFYVFVLSCVCYVLCASVYMCFVVTCWERADLLALVCGVFCEFVTFPLVSWVRCGT